MALAVLFVLATLKPQWLPGRHGAEGLILPGPSVTVVPAAPRASGVADAAGYSEAAARATPSVVSIVASRPANPNPHRGDPRFRRFFGDEDPSANMQMGLGSGVIVAPEGYLLTNNHVVEGATDIEVQLADGRAADARVVGTDPDTDLAVLKIDLDRLPVAHLGSVTGLRVGDLVLAIGNPYNFGQTVTAGIVSALGRNRLGLSTFENFIQTDASINPGNSGGALVDLQGSLVGINTAIFSNRGGNTGIGFAIPVDTARQVLDSLVRTGEVQRGWLGVEQRELTPEFARSFGVPVEHGVLISGVLKDGPASKGGVKPGDVVLRIDDQPVASTAELLAAVAALAPDSDAVLTVQRGDEQLALTLKVGRRPPLRR